MKKLLTLLMVLFGSFMITSTAYAAYNTAIFASSTIRISGIDLMVTGEVESLTVATSSFEVVLSASSSLTVLSTDKKDFGMVTVGTSPITRLCNTNDSTLVFASPAALATTTVSFIGNCPGVVDRVTGFSTSAGDSSVTLSWATPLNDGGSPILDYLVEYKLTSDSLYTLHNDGVSTATTVQINGLTNGSSYDFRVAAKNAAGIGATSSPVISLTPRAPVSGGSGGGGGGGSVSTTPVTGNTAITPTTPAPLPAVTNTTPVGTSTDTTSGGSVTLISRNLSSGSSLMSDIMILQTLLVRESLLSSTDIIGIYGPKTVQAVKDFQCKYNIVCSGTAATTGYGAVGTKTRTLANTLLQASSITTTSTNTTPTPSVSGGGSMIVPTILSSGARGANVTALQTFLVTKGLLSASDVVGIYGPKTVQAIKDYQCANNIVCSGSPSTTGWGNVGKKTQAFINSGAVTATSTQEVSTINGTSTIVTTPSTSATTITKNLTLGSTGDEVLALQTFLSQYDPQLLLESDIVGTYGPKTVKAVQEYQCRNEIVCSGSPSTTGWGAVGAKTRAKINR